MRRLIAIAAAAAAVAGLVGCSGSSSAPAPKPLPSQSTSAPLTSPSSRGSSGPSSDAAGRIPRALRRFYDQKLTWTTCQGAFECSTLTVPEDYAKPAGRTLSIAVIRKPASGTSQGSLIVNPGGPGGSGIDFVAQDAAVFEQLSADFDLVSFDPRGVGQSDPIRCVTSAQLDAFIDANPDPTTAAAHALLVRQAKEFAADCYRKNGSYLEHVGTKDQARDMDVLRAALGDRKLTYYGASYGTYLGAKYAELFPTRIRALVLDGALDPDEPLNQENLIQAKGFQLDLGDFLAQCVRSGSCPLGSSVTAAHAEVRSLESMVTAKPLTTSTGRKLGAGEFFEGLAAGLYSPTDWSALWAVLGEVKEGDPTNLLRFSDSLTGRKPDGSYTNEIESNIAINCIDRPAPRKVSTYDAKAAAFAKQAPDFGAAIEYGSLPCAFWKVPPVEPVHPVHAPGAPPILVIGTTRDPATPYVWAQALAKQLRSGVLLTYDGDGHTAYIRHDACVDAAVKSYVVNLDPPKAGTVCH